MVKRFSTGAITGVLLAIAIIAAACGPGTTPSTGGSVSADWTQANHDLSNTRVASGSPISSANVHQLGLDWSFKVAGSGVYGLLSTSPIVVNQTVYLQDLDNNVYAIDLNSGALKWQKKYHDTPQGSGPNGVAYENGMVFAASDLHTVVALKASDGTEVWSRQIAPSLQKIDEQLTVHSGMVYVSTTDFEATQPQDGTGTGIIHALDAKTGSDIWTFNTIKDGNLWGNPNVNSGGGAWYPPAIDPATGTTYWGTNNAAPDEGTKEFPNGSSRPGPNLYTESEIALDRSGKLLWYNQVTPHDLFDHDFQISPILTTASVGGSSHQIVVGAGKSGYVIAFDRQTGSQLWKTPVGVHLNDNVTLIPAGQTVNVEPGLFGGVETPMAFAGGVVYVPVINLPSNFTATGFSIPKVDEGTGELDAIDVNTGRILWTSKLDSEDFGSVVVANDLVFTATFTGEVLAFNRSSGKQVWSYQAPGGINALLAVAGDRLLIPVGLGSAPGLVALRLGATGASPTAGSTTSATASASCTPSPTTLCISTTNQGNGLSFNTTELSASAGAKVTLTYTNSSTIPHNWHLFGGGDGSSPSIAATAIKAGPNDVETISFTVPSTAGRYFFRCDVHPTLMTGFLVVH